MRERTVRALRRAGEQPSLLLALPEDVLIDFFAMCPAQTLANAIVTCKEVVFPTCPDSTCRPSMGRLDITAAERAVRITHQSFVLLVTSRVFLPAAFRLPAASCCHCCCAGGPTVTSSSESA